MTTPATMPALTATLTRDCAHLVSHTLRFLTETIAILSEEGRDTADLLEDTRPLLETMHTAAAVCLAAPNVWTMRAELERVFTWAGRVRDCALRALQARPH